MKIQIETTNRFFKINGLPCRLWLTPTGDEVYVPLIRCNCFPTEEWMTDLIPGNTPVVMSKKELDEWVDSSPVVEEM